MLEQSLGPATVLVNAAGGNDLPKVTVTPNLLFEKIALEDWRANLELNFLNRRSFAAVSGVWGCHGSERPGVLLDHECFRTSAFVSGRGLLQW